MSISSSESVETLAFRVPLVVSGGLPLHLLLAWLPDFRSGVLRWQHWPPLGMTIPSSESVEFFVVPAPFEASGTLRALAQQMGARIALRLTQRFPPARPIVELPYILLRIEDSAYNSYMEMATFQPGSSRWTSELQGVALRAMADPRSAHKVRGAC